MDDNSQSMTGATSNDDFNNLQTLTAQTNNASPFLNPHPDEFQHAQLTAEQLCVKISIHLCEVSIHLIVIVMFNP